MASGPGIYFMSVDNERFFNHSRCPYLIEEGEYHVAARDIQANEELTLNYVDLEGYPPEDYPFY